MTRPVASDPSVTVTDADRAHMARALALAERGLLHDDAQSARRLRASSRTAR